MKKIEHGFTPIGSQPPYVNFTCEDGEVRLTVRSPGTDGQCGTTAAMSMSTADFLAFVGHFIGAVGESNR